MKNQPAGAPRKGQAAQGLDGSFLLVLFLLFILMGQVGYLFAQRTGPARQARVQATARTGATAHQAAPASPESSTAGELRVNDQAPPAAPTAAPEADNPFNPPQTRTASTTAATPERPPAVTDQARAAGSATAPPAATRPRPRATSGTEVELTIAQAAGQVMMVGIPAGWSASNPSPLNTVPAGAVILYRTNVKGKSAQQVRQLCDAIRQYVKEQHGVPAPLIAIDHEGGIVDRFRGGAGVTQFPDNETLTEGPSLDQAKRKVKQEAVTMGNDLARVGIDINLAPDADVLTTTGESAIGGRSYGRDPDRVSALVSAYIQGQRTTPVRGSAKHFPGYGPIGPDPHHNIVHAKDSEATWRKIHLPPFQAAAQAGVDTIMMGHVIYDWLGTDKPASVDPAAYRLLRETTDFTGAVLTDDLEMEGLAAKYPNGFGQAAVDAVRAGADMVLVCWTPSRIKSSYNALKKAAEEGRLDLSGPVSRIKQLRAAR